MLATAPAASSARAALRLPQQQHERPDPTERREQDERERTRRHPVEDVAGVGPEHEYADEGHNAGDDRRHYCSPPEVLDHRVVCQSAGVPDEVHGGQVGAGRHGEHAADDRRRVDPAGPGIAGLAACGYAAGRDRAGNGTHAVRHEDRGEGEDRAQRPPFGRTEEALAEREACAAQHDPKRDEGEGNEERERDRREGLGEPGPEHDQREDQPHVVGFPHRADGVVDERPWSLAPVRSAGDEVPEPGAEVRAGEDRVGTHRGEQHDGDGVIHRRAPPPASSPRAAHVDRRGRRCRRARLAAGTAGSCSGARGPAVVARVR